MQNTAYNIKFTKYSETLSIMHIDCRKKFVVDNMKRESIIKIFNGDDEGLKEDLYKRFLNFKSRDIKAMSFQDFQYKKVLISSNMMDKVSSFMSFMLNRITMIILISSVIVVNLYLYFINKPVFSEMSSIDLSWIIIVFVFLFHEIGHSTACKAFGGMASEIGFGITMMVPVMFADVSSSWYFAKKQRMIINFAGIYFQNVFSSFFLVLSIILNNSNMYYASEAIFISTLYQFFPFYKSDGYWILTDILEEPRLYRKSQKLFFTFLRHLKIEFNKKNMILIIYYFIIESVVLWFITGIFIYYKEYIISLPAHLYCVMLGIAHLDMNYVTFDPKYLMVILVLFFSSKVIITDVKLFLHSND